MPEIYLEKKVATLTLQMLLENCIKHNIISQSKPLHIEIKIDDEMIVVKNNLQLKTVPNESNGIGLNNIVHRYQFLSSIAVEMIKNETEFIVKIPLL